MANSPEWEALYTRGAHNSVWPWSDLVSLVRRHCRSLGKESKVLELGCGVGANIPFFQSLGVRYYAVEGSPTAVERLRARFPEYAAQIVEGDFERKLPFACGFDLVVDRGSVTCNSTLAIEAVLSSAWQALPPGGHFIGVDWYSTSHSDYGKGRADGDEFTRNHYREGQFAEMGRVHFSDEAHLRRLFKKFELLYLEEKKVCRVEPPGGHTMATWNLVARKLDA